MYKRQLLKKSIIDPKSGMTPAQQLEAIYARCHELYPYYEETYESVRALLAEQDIRNLRKEELTDEQLDYLRGYMQDNVLPFLSPQIINARHPFPHLENGGLYIVVRLDEEAAPKAKKSKEERAREKAEGKAKATKNLGAEGVTLGIIPLPRQTSRVIELPGSGLPFMLVEHAIEMFAAEVFSMYTVKHTNVICVTRNADLDATEGAEEQGEDYREHMKRILDVYKRQVLEQGIEQGMDRLGTLIGRLIDAGRLDDAKRVSEDAAYRDKLLSEFRLQG